MRLRRNHDCPPSTGRHGLAEEWKRKLSRVCRPRQDMKYASRRPLPLKTRFLEPGQANKGLKPRAHCLSNSKPLAGHLTSGLLNAARSGGRAHWKHVHEMTCRCQNGMHSPRGWRKLTLEIHSLPQCNLKPYTAQSFWLEHS